MFTKEECQELTCKADGTIVYQRVSLTPIFGNATGTCIDPETGRECTMQLREYDLALADAVNDVVKAYRFDTLQRVFEKTPHEKN